MSQNTRSRISSILFRIALGATALSLWAYIPYRYATRPPRFEGFLGSGYAILFPMAAVFALGALVAALSPKWLDRASESKSARGILGAYGATWLAMGMLCIPSLTASAAVAPLKAAIATLHMSAQHVFLALTAVVFAWRPDVVAGVALDRPIEGEASEVEQPIHG